MIELTDHAPKTCDNAHRRRIGQVFPRILQDPSVLLSLLRCVGEGRADGRHLIAFAMDEDGDELVDGEVQAFETMRRELFNVGPVLLLQHVCCGVTLIYDPGLSPTLMWRTEMRLGDDFHQTKISYFDLLKPEERTGSVVDEVVHAGIIVVKRHEIDLSRFRKKNVLGFESLEDGDCAAQDMLPGHFRVHMSIRHDPGF